MASGASNSNNNGRAPYPPRVSTRSRTVRNSIEGGSMMMTMDDASPSSAHSPFVQGLLRYSPNNSTVWSPNNSRLASSRQLPRTRFFESNINSTPLDEKNFTSSNNNTDNGGSTTDTQVHDTSEIDGIPIKHLRKLATLELLQSPSQASFYASILHSKTHSADDALLLAQAHFANTKFTSCLRILEESMILQSDYPWEGLALACHALAATDDWTALAEVVEHGCRLAADENLHATAPSLFARLGPSQPIEDHDEIGWSALHDEISKHPSFRSSSSGVSLIHPLARILYWRGQAYHATGHFPRAALYWKRSLKMDCQCQQAWEALLSHNLIIPAEAYALIQEVDFSSNNMEWLRSLYLARIELTPQDASLEQEGYDEDKDRALPTDSLLWDTSSIQMSSPVPHFQFGPADPSPMAGTTRMQADPTSNLRTINNNKAIHPQQVTPAILVDVDQAFDNLWNVYKLQQSPQVLAMAARRAYRRYDWKQALTYCEELDQIDPVMTEAAYCYIATLILLGHKRTLFRLAHAWVAASPRSAQAWFAVGAYYYCCERYHVAQRHFCRATRLDPQCTEAWIAFGCSFAACDESDQALASFRAAQRLSPGEHTSLLYMGIEYTRTNHLVLSGYFLNAALKSSGGDPLCLHELGVLDFQKKDYTQSIQWYHRALSALLRLESIHDCIDRCHDPYWEPTVFNLGHAYRKTRQFDLALACFQRCVALCPAKHSAYSALGFTKHLMEDVDGAIVCYHQALSCKPDDPFSTEMLNRALRDALDMGGMLDGVLNESQHDEPFGLQWAGTTNESAIIEATMDQSDDTMMSP
ncbi:hypothetical protein MPSEU_000241300 [Mayamaea pseudoterrestris]|nr:hypothetical protein MPSEU_000241300 [Mayamaea pseudoterrestris]